MCHQERASLIAIATNLLANTYVLVRLWQLNATGALDGPDAPAVWAGTVLWVVPASILLVITLHLLVAFVTRDGFRPTSDERDRLFQVRGMCVTTVVFGIGMITTLVGLANGSTSLVGFLVLYYSASVGDLLGNGVRIASYRLGA